MSEWESRPIEELVAKVSSGGTPTAGDPRYYADFGTPFLKIDDITKSNGRFVEKADQSITDLALEDSAAKVFPAGTVLVTMYGTMGVTKTLRSPMATNQAIAALVPPFRCDPDYLAHALSFRRAGLERLAAQTTQPNISGTIIRRYRLPVPPLEEQRRIAEILDTIDGTIQATERVIAKRRALRAGLVADLLKGLRVTAPPEASRPNETKLPPASTSTSNSSEMAEDGRQLSDYVDLNSESLRTSTPGDLRFDYFDLSSASNGSVIESRVETLTFSTAPSRARRIARKNDFLFGTVRPLQKSHAWAPRECIASTGFAVVRAKPGLADSRFIGHFLLTEEATLRASRFAVGSGYPALGEKDLGAFAFPNVTLEEQRRIAGILDTLDSTIEHNEAELAKLRELRAGLAADLLSGRVRTVAV